MLPWHVSPVVPPQLPSALTARVELGVDALLLVLEPTLTTRVDFVELVDEVAVAVVEAEVEGTYEHVTVALPAERYQFAAGSPRH